MTGCIEAAAFELPAELRRQGIALRAEDEADLPFVARLYASTREEELAQVPWTPAQKAEFLAFQFRAQRHHYRTYTPDCAFDVLVRDGEPIGRLYLDIRPSRLHIVDIALMPSQRGQGIGTAILKALITKAQDEGKCVGIFVEKFNPALRLYRRLGFREIADTGVYLEMEWSPAEVAKQAS